MIQELIRAFGLSIGLFQECWPHFNICGGLHVDGISFPDRYPVVDDDFNPTSEPEPEVKNSGVFVVLPETLVLRDHLQRILKAAMIGIPDLHSIQMSNGL